jgi:GT2 family glycosyltransferase
MPNITIIIINWNSWNVLEICLEKLQQQTYRNFNVLVLDNASTQTMPEGMSARHANVQFVQNINNIGFAAANNQAIKMLVGVEWCVLLNPDAYPEPDWLAILVDAACKNKEYASFASRQLMYHNSNLLDGDGDVYHISGLVWRNDYGKPKQQATSEPREVFSACAAAALYRIDALKAVGGFDEDYFCYVEDVDLGFRLRLAGYRCLLVPDALVHHVGSASTGGQRSDISLYYGHRNLVWTFVKDMPSLLFWSLLPPHLLLNVVSIIWFALHGRGSVILRAKRDAVLGLPKIWKKRQQIQNSRIASFGEIWQQLDKLMIR